MAKNPLEAAYFHVLRAMDRHPNHAGLLKASDFFNTKLQDLYYDDPRQLVALHREYLARGGAPAAARRRGQEGRRIVDAGIAFCIVAAVVVPFL